MVITFWGLSRNFAVVHQNRKDPMREIQRFANLGHYLCKSMDEVKFVYKWHLRTEFETSRVK